MNIRASLFFLLLLSSFVVKANDWPQLLGPARNSYIQDSNFKGNISPQELWTVQVGEGFGGTAVSNQKVYMLDRNNDEEDVIRCWDLNTGKPLWTTTYNSKARFGFNGSRSVPAVDDKNVYTIGVLGHVTCLDKNTGKIKWQRNLNKDWGGEAPPWGFGSSPLILNNKCIVAPLSEKCGIVALNCDTGKTEWESAPFGSKPGYSSPIFYEMLGIKMIIQMSGDSIAAFVPESGKKLWQWDGYSVKRAIPAPLKIAEDKLFITGGYGSGSVMLKLKHVAGKIVPEVEFTIEKLGAQIHVPILKDNYLYANFNENDNLRKRTARQGLTCIDLKGNTKWKTGEDPNLDRGSIIMINNFILALEGQTGEIILSEASPEKYKELFRKKVLTGKGGNIWAPICYISGKILIRDQNELKCIKLY